MSGSEENKGIIPRTFQYLFAQLKSENCVHHVYVSFIQIYLETIQDLLNPETKDIRIREDPDSGVFVEGVEWIKVQSPSDCESIFRYGEKNRVTQSTAMNMYSSRSHAIFMFRVEKKNKQNDDNNAYTNTNIMQQDKSMTRSMLYLVDLAGSERMKKTKSDQLRLEEAKKINYSLLVLGNCIQSLTDKRSMHISYRDSKLTRLLQDSLGGNAKTTLIVTISPSSYNTDETISSLNFASRAMKVQNRPLINTTIDYHALANKLQNDLDKLTDQYSQLKLEHEKVVSENERIKSGEEYLEMQKKSMINSLNDTMRRNSQEGNSANTSTVEYEIKKLEAFYANTLKRKSEECQKILMEIDKILYEKENEVDRLKSENEALKLKIDNQSESMNEMQKQNEDLIKSVSDLNAKIDLIQDTPIRADTEPTDRDDANIEKRLIELEKENLRLKQFNNEIVLSYINKTQNVINELNEEKNKLKNANNSIVIQSSRNEIEMRINDDEIKCGDEDANKKLLEKNKILDIENEKKFIMRNKIKEKIQKIDNKIDLYAKLIDQYEKIKKSEIAFDEEKTHYICEVLNQKTEIENLKCEIKNKSHKTKIINKPEIYTRIIRESEFDIISQNETKKQNLDFDTIFKYETMIQHLQSELQNRELNLSQTTQEKEKYLLENKTLLSSKSKNSTVISELNAKISNFFLCVDKLDKKYSNYANINPSNFNFANIKTENNSLKLLVKFIRELMNKIYNLTSMNNSNIIQVEELNNANKNYKTTQITNLQKTLSLLSKFDIDQMQKIQKDIFALSLSTPMEDILRISNETYAELIEKYIQARKSNFANYDSFAKDKMISSLREKNEQSEFELSMLKSKLNEYENNMKIMKIDIENQCSNFEFSSKLNFIFGYIILLVILTIIIYSSS